MRQVLASLVPHYEPGLAPVPATITVGGPAGLPDTVDVPEPTVVVAGRIGPDASRPVRRPAGAGRERTLAAA